ncbi:MAG: hypothetical protein IJN62_04155 [Clostridia bacterium]|nr:hypothetical protein [Clostridia bacterium]
MWYLILAASLYACIYTVSYGVWEWKNSNKSAAVAVCVLSVAAVVIPLIKIFMV